MNKLIKLSFAIILTIGVNFLFAQKGADEKSKIMVTKLTEKLVLTAEQQAQATNIFTEHFNTMKTLKDQMKSGANEQTKAIIKDQRKKTDEKFTSILTDDQKTKYITAKKEMRETMKNKMGERRKGNKTSNNDLQNQLDDEAF